jgi:hypothetical protein
MKEIIPGYETRLIHGFSVLLSTQAIKEGKKDHGRPFKALDDECNGLVEVLPQTAVRVLQKVLIWVEWDAIDPANPRVLAKYYGGNIWTLPPNDQPLKKNAVELLSLKKLTEEKERSIERARLVLLHELAHAVHHLLLGDEHPGIRFAYKQAMDRRLYESAVTDWGTREKPYAATNDHEYFAELTCAYLDRCPYYPFNYKDLEDHDPTGYRLMKTVWGELPAKKENPK